MPYVKVNDIQMYCEMHGDGEPLVVILGLGTDVSEWDGIIRWLTEKYKVLAFDNRGAGRTDKPDIPFSGNFRRHLPSIAPTHCMNYTFQRLSCMGRKISLSLTH